MLEDQERGRQALGADIFRDAAQSASKRAYQMLLVNRHVTTNSLLYFRHFSRASYSAWKLRVASKGASCEANLSKC